MDYIHYVLNISIVLVIVIVITKICMVVAAYVGEQLGVGKFLINLWRKMRKK
jgi:hypothetical protein